MKNNNVVNSLFLKIFGVITMTCDHFSKLCSFMNITWINENLLNIFDIIGRLSFPIFAFLIIEGMIHSSNKNKYLLRLFILSVVCDLCFYLFTSFYWGNPITTLFLGAYAIYFLQKKNNLLKLLSIIPSSIILLISFEVIPLLSMYDLYGFITILLFYLGYLLSKPICRFVSKTLQIEEEIFVNEYEFVTRKLISSLLFLIFTIIIWISNPIYKTNNIFIDEPTLQLYSILSIIPILFYNGKKGYNNKWVQYIFYLYFPLHLGIIYLLLLII